jgi:hypothetical protein
MQRVRRRLLAELASESHSCSRFLAPAVFVVLVRVERAALRSWLHAAKGVRNVKDRV